METDSRGRCHGAKRLSQLVVAHGSRLGVIRWFSLLSAEVLLNWSEILWDSDRFTATAPTRPGGTGKPRRVLPLVPELWPIREEAYELASAGAGPVAGPRLCAPASILLAFGYVDRRS